MKIALICTERLPIPSIRGGAIQILIDGILPYFGNENEITVFGVKDNELADYEIKDKIEYIRFEADNYSYNIAGYISKKCNIYDIIHVFNRPNDVLIYKSASPKSRFVLSLHNEMFKEGKITYELGCLVISACDRIITVSEYIKNTIINRFPSASNKTFAFYSGVDTKSFFPVYSSKHSLIRAEVRARFGITNEKVFLFAGRLRKIKGVDILIKAFIELQSKIDNSVLLIVGSRWFSDDYIDEYGEEIRKLVEDNHLNNVIFTGFVQPKDIPDIFLAADIFVCSSQWQEPLARVHYEAMASGLPIITTNRGGNNEIFRNTHSGIVLDDYSNPSAFCEIMSLLAQNPDLCINLGRNAHELACNKYDFSHVADRIMGYYKEACCMDKDVFDKYAVFKIADDLMKKNNISYNNIKLVYYNSQKSVYEIDSERGLLNIVRLSCEKDKLDNIVALTNLLSSLKIRLPKIVSSSYKEFYYEIDGFYYVITETISGRNLSYTSHDDLSLLVSGLVDLHKISVDANNNKLIAKLKKFEMNYLTQKDKLDNLKSIIEKSGNLYNSNHDIILNINDQINISYKYFKSVREDMELFTSAYALKKLSLDDFRFAEDNKLYIINHSSIETDFSTQNLIDLCYGMFKNLGNNFSFDQYENLIYKYIKTVKPHEINYYLMIMWYPYLLMEFVENTYDYNFDTEELLSIKKFENDKTSFLRKLENQLT